MTRWLTDDELASWLPLAGVMLRLGPSSAVVDPDWSTLRYTPACQKNSFDSYVRDVDFSPDGSYFVVVSSGAGYNGTLCDSAARFDTAVTGPAVEPTWVAATMPSAFSAKQALNHWADSPNPSCSRNGEADM